MIMSMTIYVYISFLFLTNIWVRFANRTPILKVQTHVSKALFKNFECTMIFRIHLNFSYITYMTRKHAVWHIHTRSLCLDSSHSRIIYQPHLFQQFHNLPLHFLPFPFWIWISLWEWRSSLKPLFLVILWCVSLWEPLFLRHPHINFPKRLVEIEYYTLLQESRALFSSLCLNGEVVNWIWLDSSFFKILTKPCNQIYSLA